MADKRTTVTIEENLLKEAKREALEADKTLKEIFEEGLRERLRQKKPKGRKVKFTAYPLGVKGNLSREEIYDWL